MWKKIELLLGEKFGKLTVIKETDSESDKRTRYLCKCECGNETIVVAKYLISGHTRSCGCLREKYTLIPSGTKFNKLTVVKFLGVDGKHNYLCKCDCGGEKIVTPRGLKSGDCKSCGCLQNKNKIIPTGTRFGKLTVIKEADIGINGVKSYLCKCDCGNEKIIRGSNLKSGNSTNCGCDRYGKRMHNMIGKKFGRLLVLERATEGEYPIQKRPRVHWKCQCDCGNIVIVSANSLSTGVTSSCGCLRSELAKLPSGKASFNVIYNKYKYRADRFKREFTLSEDQFKNIICGDCVYCGASSSLVQNHRYNNGNFIYTGIDRLDSSKGYTLENSVSCCVICNRAKMQKSKEDFLNWIEKVYNHSIKK